ncbi:MAG: guanylate kinase [Bacillota bacterium]|jgi:guanylate kinase
MPPKGLLLIISGPSGVGKGSICHLLLRRNPQLAYSVSATTRSPRQGEKEGVNYYFVDHKCFKSMIDQGEFLEWAEVYHNYYGTPRSTVEELLSQGKDVILEIDTQGAIQVKAACPEGIFIFILPPSYDELKRRIVGRRSEDHHSLNCRLNSSTKEMDLAEQYDYTVINDDLEETVEEIEAIIKREKAKSCGKGD